MKERKYEKELAELMQIWNMDDEAETMRRFCQAHYIMRRNSPKIAEIIMRKSFGRELYRIFECIMDERDKVCVNNDLGIKREE